MGVDDGRHGARVPREALGKEEVLRGPIEAARPSRPPPTGMQAYGTPRSSSWSGYSERAFSSHSVLHLEAPFLQKPFMLEALAQKVREVLDGTGASVT
jgi:hypothetical protein